jgi:hypothetical protein
LKNFPPSSVFTSFGALETIDYQRFFAIFAQTDLFAFANIITKNNIL